MVRHATILGLGLLLLGGSVAAAKKGKPNRLLGEKSPYLLQHAYNPVDWYPWGEEAFAKARKLNKPILLSIGYSTCHWCHVMERESFSNPKIAAIINKHFVAIKVDREERPDIDAIYMAAATGVGWGGGWPLNMFLTPELKPFYGGTYFAPERKWGRPGFPEILETIAENWRADGDSLIARSRKITELLKESAAVSGREAEPESSWLESGFRGLEKDFDEDRGGFGGAPKFPMPGHYSFLLRYWARTGEKKALEMVRRSLREMAKGGIYDHVGGGSIATRPTPIGACLILRKCFTTTRNWRSAIWRRTKPRRTPSSRGSRARSWTMSCA